MTKTINRNIQDKSQSSIFDFGDFTEEEKKQILEPQIQHVSHENHIEDSKIIKDNNDESNIRSEQVIISKDNYSSISISDNPKQFSESINNISKCNHFSKNLYNQCLFEIRQAFFGKIDDSKDEKEKDLRIKIRSADWT